MKKTLILFLIVFGFQGTNAARYEGDIESSRLSGIGNDITGIRSALGNSAMPTIPMSAIMGDRVSCMIDSNVEGRAQKCEIATQDATQRAQEFATAEAVDKADALAVEEMKGLRAICDRAASSYRNSCVNKDLSGMTNPDINSCEDILPIVASTKNMNSELLNSCADFASAVEEACTRSAVGTVPANSISSEGRSSDGWATATSSNPEEVVREIRPEIPMVEAYENTLANYEALRNAVESQIADLTRVEVQANECRNENIFANVESQRVEYTEDTVDSGVEASVNDVALARFSQKAAEADAAGAYMESRQNTSGGVPVRSDISPEVQTYISSSPDYGTTTRVASTSGSGGDINSILGNGGGSVDLPVTSPRPRPRPDRIGDNTTTPASSDNGAKVSSKEAAKPTKNNTSATTAANNSNNSSGTNNNNATNNYLNNTQGYGGGNAGGSSGFDPSSLLGGLGGQPNASEKMGQYNGIDYSGNTFYSNSNGRYTNNNGGSKSSSRTKSSNGGGNFASPSAMKAGANDQPSNYGGQGSAGSWAGGGYNSNGSFGAFGSGSGGSNSNDQDAGRNSKKHATKKSGSKQVFSSKNESTSGGATRIFASAKTADRVPASIESFKKAKENGAQFDPTKYEPTTAASRKAYERATGRHIGGRRAHGGGNWPADIRQCEGQNNCTTVFNHMSDQFRIQFGADRRL